MEITLNDMANLARALEDADEAVKRAANALKVAEEKARMLREETIPSAMQELGLESLKLNTGKVLKVNQEVYASIPKANKPDAFRWLNDNGFGGLIKLSVIIPYGKGDQQKALELFQELQGRGLSASCKEDVHAQTLKAFLKEQIAKGNKELPMDLFGARPVWCAKIK